MRKTYSEKWQLKLKRPLRYITQSPVTTDHRYHPRSERCKSMSIYRISSRASKFSLFSLFPCPFFSISFSSQIPIQKSIDLQKSPSIQPRTSLTKDWRWFNYFTNSPPYPGATGHRVQQIKHSTDCTESTSCHDFNICSPQSYFLEKESEKQRENIEKENSYREWHNKIQKETWLLFVDSWDPENTVSTSDAWALVIEIHLFGSCEGKRVSKRCSSSTIPKWTDLSV